MISMMDYPHIKGKNGIRMFIDIFAFFIYGFVRDLSLFDVKIKIKIYLIFLFLRTICDLNLNLIAIKFQKLEDYSMVI
jgi:hypothetical protein